MVMMAVCKDRRAADGPPHPADGPMLCFHELEEPRLRRGGEIIIFSAPGKPEPRGVQGVVRQDEPGALFAGQPALDQGEIQIGVAAVKLVAHDGMAEVLEMDADLMLASGEGEQAQKREWKMADGGWRICGLTQKSFLHEKFRLGGVAVGPHTILDGHHAGVILAERGVHDPLLRHDVAVDDGEIFFLHGAGFPDFAQFPRGDGVFGDEDEAGSLAVKAMDQMGIG